MIDHSNSISGFVVNRFITCLLILSLLPVLSKLSTAEANTHCECEFKNEFATAIRASDFPTLNRLFASSKVAAACPRACVDHWRKLAIGAVTYRAGELLAVGKIDAAHKLVSNKGEAKFVYGSHWNVNATLGDIASARKDWKEAALQYADAQEKAARDDDVKDHIHRSLFQLSSEALRLHGSLDVAMSCLLYTSPSPRDKRQSRMPSSA